MNGNDPLLDGLQVYLVGGAVRDALLGRAGGDRDWVVVGSEPAELLRRGFKTVGADFPVFLHPHTGEEYALARTERKSGRGYRGFVVDVDPSVTLEQDLLRRDLTINAIAQDREGRLIDPHGGVADLQARVLRHVSPAFGEDPVRILRVALARLLPEVEALYGVEQRVEFHPEIDAGIHTELCLAQSARWRPRDARVAFAVLLHDLGKALTPRGEWPKHVLHEQRGIAPIETVCQRLRVPTEFRDLAVHACREHLNVHRLDEMRPISIEALLSRCDAWRKPDRIAEIGWVCEIDKRGRLGGEDQPYPNRMLLQHCLQAAQRVQARDLDLSTLQGPAIGEALRKARVAAIRASRAEAEGISPKDDAVT